MIRCYAQMLQPPRTPDQLTIDHVDELRARALRQVRVVFDGPVPPAAFDSVPNVTDVVVEDGVLRCRLVGEADGLIKALSGHRVIDLISEEPQLEELFLHYYTGAEDDVA